MRISLLFLLFSFIFFSDLQITSYLAQAHDRKTRKLICSSKKSLFFLLGTSGNKKKITPVDLCASSSCSSWKTFLHVLHVAELQAWMRYYSFSWTQKRVYVLYVVIIISIKNKKNKKSQKREGKCNVSKRHVSWRDVRACMWEMRRETWEICIIMRALLLFLGVSLHGFLFSFSFWQWQLFRLYFLLPLLHLFSFSLCILMLHWTFFERYSVIIQATKTYQVLSLEDTFCSKVQTVVIIIWDGISDGDFHFSICRVLWNILGHFLYNYTEYITYTIPSLLINFHLGRLKK